MYFKILLFFQLCTMVIGNYNGKEVMKTVARTFGRTVFECQDEMRFDSDNLEKIFNFWDKDQALDDRDMGCILRCILLKLELVDESGNLNDANADGFLKANGADDAITNLLIKLYHSCYNSVSLPQDDCMLILELGKCSREGVRQAHWTPV